MKTFYTMMNVGHAKYVVNSHDGVRTHADGSRFFGIAIFKNKKRRDEHIRLLKEDGYTETN